MLKNGIYNLIGSVLRLAIVVSTTPILIRLIGIQEYGLWTLVTAVVSMATLAEAGLSISTTVFLSKDLAANDNKAFSETFIIVTGLILVLATLAALFLWLGSDLIVMFFGKLTLEEQKTATTAIQIGSIAVWARLIQQVLFGPLQALQRYALLNVVNTLQAMVTNVMLVVIAFNDGLTVEMIVGLSIASVLFFLLFVVINIVLLKDRLIAVRFNGIKFFEIAKYSMMTWISALGGQLFSQGDRMIVGLVLGTATLGVYAAITSVTAQITALTAMAISPLLPRLSAMWHHGMSKRTDLYMQLEQATVLNSFVALGSGSLMFVLGPYLLRLLLPDLSTSNVLLAFQITTLIYAIYVLNAVGYYLLFAIEAVHSNLVINLGSGVLSLVLITVGAHFWGLIGAALGNIGYAVSLLFVYYGMYYVGLPFSRWLHWTAIPLLWFVFTIITNILLSGWVDLQIGIYGLQIFSLLWWFVHTQHEVFQLIPQQVQIKLNRLMLPSRCNE